MQNVQFEKFDGPLDLLLSLLGKEEIAICDIPIAKITEQYMQYIYTAQQLDIDLAADFIVIAAQLIEIKSKTLLPPDEEDGDEEEDPRQELINRLTEYKIFKQISSYIGQFEEGYNEITGKDPEYFPQLKDDYSDMQVDAQLFAQAIRAVFAKYNLKLNENPIGNYRVAADEISTEEMMLNIGRLLEQKNKIGFFELFETNHTRGYIIAAFLAILEMLKMNAVTLEQDSLYADITIRKNDK